MRIRNDLGDGNQLGLAQVGLRAERNGVVEAHKGGESEWSKHIRKKRGAVGGSQKDSRGNERSGTDREDSTVALSLDNEGSNVDERVVVVGEAVHDGLDVKGSQDDDKTDYHRHQDQE